MPLGDRKLTMSDLGRITPEDYVKTLRHPVRFVLDDVRSRHNVGSLFRTADAFGLEGVTLCGFTPVPPHREIEKTALGATLSVPWEHKEDPVEVVRSLQQLGYRVLAVEQTQQAETLHNVTRSPGERIALVLGNELHGVSDAVILACDGCLSIPQFGSKHSLNVAVCAGVVAWWMAGRWPPA